MTDEPRLTLQVVCHTMPGRTFGPFRDVELGIQRGQESVDAIGGDAPEAAFTAYLRVRRDLSTGAPNFLGPYAHGTPGGRFLYLSWSGVADGGRRMFRRLKIPLGPVTWEQAARALTENVPLRVRVRMTAEDGSPACGTARAGVAWSSAR